MHFSGSGRRSGRENPFADTEGHGRCQKPEVKLFLTLESLCLLLPSTKVLVFLSQGWFSYYSVFSLTLPQGGPPAHPGSYHNTLFQFPAEFLSLYIFHVFIVCFLIVHLPHWNMCSTGAKT